MNPRDLALSYVRNIAPYQPGKPISELAREMGLDEHSIIKLASNENPLGMSPKARRAIEHALPELARYPDGNGFTLKKAIAEKLKVMQDNIVLGNGSNDVLELVAQVFLASGRAAVYSQYAFAVYPLATQARGAHHIVVKAKNFGHDLVAMRQAITPATAVIFIANPNNPTGTLLTAGEVKAFVENVPADKIIVLDEAYNEYLSSSDQTDSIAWLKKHPNLIITRTFSKAYGLAGLRVGYAIAHSDIVDLMNRVRQPFNVSHLAQMAATAALHDDEFVNKSVALNQKGLRQLIDGFKKLDLSYIPSYGNFLCVCIGTKADVVYKSLLKKGVIVRPLTSYDMPSYLRVTVGLPEENDRFLNVLTTILKDLTLGAPNK